MAIKLPANLHRNRYGVLYFRLGVPDDLRHHFTSAEIYQSLRTASVKEAAYHAQALSAAFKRTFFLLRQTTMPSSKESPKTAFEEFQSLPDVRQRLKAAGRKIALAEKEAQLIKMENEILDLEERRKHEQDIFGSTLDRISKAMTSVPSVTPVGDGRRISDYVEPYIASVRAARKPPAEQTIKSYEVSARLFIEIIGDKPLHELNHKDRNCYDEAIFRIPKNRQKMPSTRGKTLAEMLAMPDLKCMSSSTVKDESLRANLFLDWIFHQEGRPTPFKLLAKFKVDKSDVKKRRPFTDAELRQVFNPSILRKDLRPSPYKYWLTLIALHTGARLDEIAQLGLSDIIIVDGVHCFNVTPTEDPDEGRKLAKHVKSDYGKRLVPIHSRLLDLGLLNYIRELRDERHTMLFPDLAHAQTNLGSLAGKWFGRYCDSLGLTNSDLAFHSFRHGAVTIMTKGGVQRELRKIVIGHSHKEDVHDDYIHVETMFDTADKQRAIEALSFSDALDYAALKLQAPSMSELRLALARNAKHSPESDETL